MDLDIAVRDGAMHQEAFAARFARGCARHGITARRISAQQPAAHHVVCWGWSVGEYYRQKGHDVLVAERGYIGDRFKWTSLGWNGLNGRAAFPEPPDDGARWRAHFEPLIAPWREGGDYILMMGQVPGDMAIRGVNLDRWYLDTARDLARHGLPVRFRPHPMALERRMVSDIAGAPILDGPLVGALTGAAWVVTYNSNSAVDAVLAGVPAVSCDLGSMAWDITGHDVLKPPPKPYRGEWASRMAWTQWTDDEIESGRAWEAAQSCL